MNNKRNTVLLIIITIAVFLITILGATFTYFAAEKAAGNSIDANIDTVASMYSFTASSPDNIEMSIAFNEMSQASVSNTVIRSDSASIAVSLSSPNNDTATICTYDIVWIWDGGDIYESPDGGTLPIVKDDVTYNYEFSTTVDGSNETDLSNAKKRSGNKVKIQEGLRITSGSTTATTNNHEIKAKIYNLPLNQTNLFGKNFKAHVTIDNISCSMKKIDMTPLETTSEEGSLAYHIINNVYNSTENRRNIAVNEAGLYYHNAALTNGANDKTLRYAGADADVDNYVCFQEENMDCSKLDNLYRIISVDSTTNQTKVIKATNTYLMPWNRYIPEDYDESIDISINKWENTSLQEYLNNDYLTSLGAKAEKIEKTIWSVGGASDDDLKNKNVKDFMDVELNTNTKIERKIGLMYLSEYGFAALPEYWANTLGSNSSNGYGLSKGKDWMLTPGNPWTISRYSDYTIYAFYINSDAGYVFHDGVSASRGVRPSFVLSSGVKITNAEAKGVGSIEVPMIIN